MREQRILKRTVHVHDMKKDDEEKHHPLSCVFCVWVLKKRERLTVESQIRQFYQPEGTDVHNASGFHHKTPGGRRGEGSRGTSPSRIAK